MEIYVFHFNLSILEYLDCLNKPLEELLQYLLTDSVEGQ